MILLLAHTCCLLKHKPAVFQSSPIVNSRCSAVSETAAQAASDGHKRNPSGSSDNATVQAAAAEGAPCAEGARKLTLVDPATNTSVPLPAAAARPPSRGAATLTPPQQRDPWLINLSDSDAKSEGGISPNGMTEVTSQMHSQYSQEALLAPEGGGGGGGGLTADQSQPKGSPSPQLVVGVKPSSSAAADSPVEAKTSGSPGAVANSHARPSAESPSGSPAGRSAAKLRPEVRA